MKRSKQITAALIMAGLSTTFAVYAQHKPETGPKAVEKKDGDKKESDKSKSHGQGAMHKDHTSGPAAAARDTLHAPANNAGTMPDRDHQQGHK